MSLGTLNDSVAAVAALKFLFKELKPLTVWSTACWSDWVSA